MKVKTLRRASEPLQPHLLITPICSCHLHDRFYSFSLLPSCVSLFPLPDTVRSLTECKDCACAEHFDVGRDKRTQAPLYQSRPSSMTCEQLSNIAKISPSPFFSFLNALYVSLCGGQWGRFLNISAASVQNGVSAWACVCLRCIKCTKLLQPWSFMRVIHCIHLNLLTRIIISSY